MGMLRKTLSISTGGAVAFRKPKEVVAQAAKSSAKSQSKVAKAEARLLARIHR